MCAENWPGGAQSSHTHKLQVQSLKSAGGCSSTLSPMLDMRLQCVYCLFPPSPTSVLPDTQGGITVQLRVSLQHEAPAISPKYHYTSSTTLVSGIPA